MPLVKSTLEQQIKSIFKSMSKLSSGGDEFLALQLGNAIQTYVSTGILSTTVDSGMGVAPPGPYIGKTSGTMSVIGATISSLLLPILKSMFKMSSGGDVYFANQLGTVLTTAFSSAICVGTSSGTISSLPFGTPVPTVVPIMGTVVGIPTVVSSILIPAFKTMSKMSKGGDDYLAGQMATAIDNFIKSLTIIISGTAPATFVSKGSLS